MAFENFTLNHTSNLQNIKLYHAQTRTLTNIWPSVLNSESKPKITLVTTEERMPMCRESEQTVKAIYKNDHMVYLLLQASLAISLLPYLGLVLWTLLLAFFHFYPLKNMNPSESRTLVQPLTFGGWDGQFLHSLRIEQNFSQRVGDFDISLMRFLNLWLQSPPLQWNQLKICQ